jgi:hypothetical protein
MTLKAHLAEKKAAITNSWFQSILETYPPDSVKFLERQKDQFQNPVGYIISDGIAVLFEKLLEDTTSPDYGAPLENIIRVRSVQDFSPSKAVEIIFLLKGVVRNVLSDEIKRDHLLMDELHEFDLKVDQIALAAFDVYMKSREKIYEIRVNEAKTGGFKCIERLNRPRRIAGHPSGSDKLKKREFNIEGDEGK